MKNRGYTLAEIVVTLLVLSVLASIAIPAYDDYQESVKVKIAQQQIVMIAAKISQYETDMGYYPESLSDIEADNIADPWNRPYQYTNLSASSSTGKARKDHNLVPLNSDFDLYSLGKDGKSVAPITAPVSKDDVLRAYDGKFVDLGKNL